MLSQVCTEDETLIFTSAVIFTEK